MTVPTKERVERMDRLTVRGLLIVARDQLELYDYLQHAYGGSAEVTVLFDRRHADRRQTVQSVRRERRRKDRRRLPSLADDLRFQQYVLVRPCSRRPRD